MPPTMSVSHYMHSYLCACNPTQLEASYIAVHVWHRLTSDVRSVLGSTCEYHHLALCRVASVGSLDMIGSQQPRFSAAEGDDLKILFGIVLDTMRNNKYMDRMTAPRRRSQNVNIFHRANWCKFLQTAAGSWLHIDETQKRDHLRRWLFRKFSVDVHSVTMYPADPNARRPSNAGWPGFYMTDAELGRLVNDIFAAD